MMTNFGASHVIYIMSYEQLVNFRVVSFQDITKINSELFTIGISNTFS